MLPGLGAASSSTARRLTLAAVMSAAAGMQRPYTAVYIATSLDGFIARTDGGIDWLPNPADVTDADGKADDMGFDEFMASLDGILMGRKTFDPWINGQFDHTVEWPYTKPVTVLSTTLTQSAVPERLKDKPITFTAGAPADVLAGMARAGCKKVYVDGGTLISSLLEADLVDEMAITTVPVLIGEGARLFGGKLSGDLAWEIVGTPRAVSTSGGGLVQCSYKRKRQ